ncbi:glycoprotease [Colletotrichum fioriniae PJ7]|uniref:Glycoprotease n=1 Tax=Colletotrichum fioriniae PJ7 TaxID=1445577 RepID=A0A010QT25_9PEZI|nr:glycoprotease [Colletotrichum fioriniae PJ7]
MPRPPLTILQIWRAPSLSLHRTINGSAVVAQAAHVRPSPFRERNQLHRQRQHQCRTLLTLAIESSCDDTCVALLSKDPGTHGRATLHFHRKITSDSTAYGGVYPPVALRSHDASLAPLIAEALTSLPAAAGEVQNNDDGDSIQKVGKGGGRTHAEVGSSRHNTLTVAGTLRQKPDFVTVTRGPGMSANLASGLSTAKGLATAWQVPLLAVNHMQAHALTPRLVSALARQDPTTSTASSSTTTSSSSPTVDVTAAIKPEYPFLTLLVSGGHTQLVHSHSLASHRILASSSNIAVGDALDKAARHILPPDMLASHGDVMYGALLERFAFPDSFPPFSTPSPDPKRQHDYDHDYEYTPPLRRVDEIAPYAAPAPYSWTLHPPLSASRALSYEFNGLGSEVRKIATSKGDSMSLDERRILARATMRLLFEHLATRIFLALAAEPELKDALKTLVVSGGVASNRFLMHVLRKMLDVRGFEHVEITAPPPALCTDNAVMIAWTGMEMYEAGWESLLSVHPERKWSIDPSSEEGGILGVPGWRRREY